MAYYNSYQYNYPQYPQYQQPQQDERIWVQNQTGAESYLVAPNSFVRLWDSSQPVFYEKRADSTGRPYPLDIYDYTRRATESPKFEQKQSTLTNIQGDEIKRLEKRIELLERKIKDDKQSDADDTAVPTVQESVSGKS